MINNSHVFFWEFCPDAKHVEMLTDEQTKAVIYSCYGSSQSGVHCSTSLDSVDKSNHGTIVNALMQYACESRCPYYKKEDAS